MPATKYEYGLFPEVNLQAAGLSLCFSRRTRGFSLPFLSLSPPYPSLFCPPTLQPPVTCTSLYHFTSRNTSSCTVSMGYEYGVCWGVLFLDMTMKCIQEQLRWITIDSELPFAFESSIFEETLLWPLDHGTHDFIRFGLSIWRCVLGFSTVFFNLDSSQW